MRVEPQARALNLASARLFSRSVVAAEIADFERGIEPVAE
jgi:hypothetical protein